MDWTWDLSKLYESFDDPRFAADMEFVAAKVAEARETVAGFSHDKCEVCQLEKAIDMLTEIETISSRGIPARMRDLAERTLKEMESEHKN